MKTGVSHLPLHSGRAPAWLFGRMKLLAREIVLVILCDFGPAELLRRLSNPFWFQALGCALGFDWNSSGLTTTTCGALKEGLRGMEHEVGFFVCGGKGRVSRATPREIEGHGKHLRVDPQTWSMPAACRPRWTAAPSRMATSCTITRFSSTARDTGPSFSRA